MFLKGCPLRCAWCSNPESLSIEPEIMLRDKRCVRLGKCAKVCPQRAISLVDNHRVIDWERCDRCGKCAEVLPVVMHDVCYYQRSGGGMTLALFREF